MPKGKKCQCSENLGMLKLFYSVYRSKFVTVLTLFSLNPGDRSGFVFCFVEQGRKQKDKNKQPVACVEQCVSGI